MCSTYCRIMQCSIILHHRTRCLAKQPSLYHFAIDNSQNQNKTKKTLINASPEQKTLWPHLQSDFVSLGERFKACDCDCGGGGGGNIKTEALQGRVVAFLPPLKEIQLGNLVTQRCMERKLGSVHAVIILSSRLLFLNADVLPRPPFFVVVMRGLSLFFRIIVERCHKLRALYFTLTIISLSHFSKNYNPKRGLSLQFHPIETVWFFSF